jgi:hypothetical protein
VLQVETEPDAKLCVYCLLAIFSADDFQSYGSEVTLINTIAPDNGLDPSVRLENGTANGVLVMIKFGRDDGNGDITDDIIAHHQMFYLLLVESRTQAVSKIHRRGTPWLIAEFDFSIGQSLEISG